MNFALKKLLWVQMDKNITLSSCVYKEFNENASRVLKTFMLCGFYSNLSVFVVRLKYDRLINDRLLEVHVTSPPTIYSFMLCGFYSNLSVFVVRLKYCSAIGNTSRWEKSAKNRP